MVTFDAESDCLVSNIWLLRPDEVFLRKPYPVKNVVYLTQQINLMTEGKEEQTEGKGQNVDIMNSNTSGQYSEGR